MIHSLWTSLSVPDLIYTFSLRLQIFNRLTFILSYSTLNDKGILRYTRISKELGLFIKFILISLNVVHTSGEIVRNLC